MRAVLALAIAMAAVVVAMPHEQHVTEKTETERATETEIEITELSGDALLEAQAAVASHAAVRVDENYSTAPYKFFIWNPTGAGHTTVWNGRRGPQAIITALRAAMTAAGIAARCGANDRCVLLGPEFIGAPQDRLSFVEFGEWKRDLTRLSAEPQYMNVLLAPGTFVFRAKGSAQTCAADARVVWPRRRPDQPLRMWYSTEDGWRNCWYNFNVLVAAFRGHVLIEHHKVMDGGTAAAGAAFDATARPDLLRVTPQSKFRVPGWGILVGVEICADHSLHRVKRATNDMADLQLSPFYPGSITAANLLMTGVKDGGFVVQNGGINRANQVFKRTGTHLTRFYQVPPHANQVGVDRTHDIYEYVGAAPAPQAPAPLRRLSSGGLPPRGGGRPGLQRTGSSQSLRRN